MAIENDPSARFQVRSRGELLLPACCAVCGNGTRDEGYLDLDLFFDFHGRVYLCMECATSAAETIGFISLEAVKLIKQTAESLEAANAELQKELDNVRPFMDFVRNGLGSDLANHGDVVSEAVSVELPEPVEAAVAGKPKTEELNPFAGRTDSSGSKPHNVTRRGSRK